MDRNTRRPLRAPRLLAASLFLSTVALAAPGLAATGPSRPGDPSDIVSVQVTPGLQFMIGEGAQAYLDPQDAERTLLHRSSGFSCPLSLVGGAIVLKHIDAGAGSLLCQYRDGPNLTFDPDAHVKYQFLIVKGSGSVGSVMKDLTAGARQALPIAADKAAPAQPGAAPRPQAARFWTLRDGSVQGLWLGKTRGWFVRLQVDYPDTAANEAEAKAVAEALFQAPSKAAR